MKKIKELFWKSATKDNTAIYGVTNSRDGNKNVIIFVHGLTRDKHDHLFQHSARFFPKKGFDTIRFDLYSGREDGRKLATTSMDQHINDLTCVVNEAAKSYDKIFIVGHSFGGPIALATNHPQVAAYSLWDPSFDVSVWAECAIPLGDKFVISAFGKETVYSPRMIEDFKKYNKARCENLGKNANAPLQIVFAKDGEMLRRGISYHTFAKEAQSDVVENSDHLFTPTQAADQLCAVTLDWFKKKKSTPKL